MILQVFLNICERLQYKGFAFTRQRTLVRSQHRPLRKVAFCRYNVRSKKGPVSKPYFLCTSNTPTQHSWSA